MKQSFALLLLFAGLAQADEEALPDLATYTAELERHPGFLDLYWDEARGQVLVELDRFDEPLIRVTALAGGLGSNDVGLDRGQLGSTRVVEFRRVGRRVLMVEPNLRYRAESENPEEVRAVAEAFAESVLASLPVRAADEATVLVDLTEHLLSDVHGVTRRLEDGGQGTFKLDTARSAPLPGRLRGFPGNSVAEAVLTFTSDQPGPEVISVTPDPGSVSLRVQHQFVALPDPGFERRAFHPRSGYFPFGYRDYAVPLGESVDRRVLVRHRLQLDADGRTLEPLIYYVDRGAPEPIRSALMEGAGWWAEAFAAAGFADGFRVELLPEGVDPLDVRYNVIQWVHRSTRGWSYGASVRDPRSGEIIKGHISLGSLRVRQDMLIAEGLTAPFATGEEAASEVQALALARLRQLSAHEVGHTLGLAHNFAASAADDASVMDYPHPFVRMDDGGGIAIDAAYDTGIGNWDKLAIEYGYRVFASETERDAGLAALLERADRLGLRFVSDPDARGFGSVHAVAHLWDNGADPLERFDELSRIRSAALAAFGEAALRKGEPYSRLEHKLVPVYLSHRYQAEAVAKLLGGLSYDHRIKGDDSVEVRTEPAARQRQALEALIEALAPDSLRLDPGLLERLQPPAYGHSRGRESFAHGTGSAFDAWAPARAMAQLVAELLLEPARLRRLEQQHWLDPQVPGAGEVMAELATRRIAEAVASRRTDPMAVQVAWVLLREVQRLALDAAAGDRVRGLAMAVLGDLVDALRSRPEGRAMADEIRRFLAEPVAESLPPRETIPPGSPI